MNPVDALSEELLKRRNSTAISITFVGEHNTYPCGCHTHEVILMYDLSGFLKVRDRCPKMEDLELWKRSQNPEIKLDKLADINDDETRSRSSVDIQSIKSTH